MDRREFLGGAAALAGGVIAGPAFAAGSLLKFIYPYAPGSGGDAMLRALSTALQSRLNVSAIVENRVGADGRIGVREARNAAPDGDTLLFTPFGAMVLFPSVFKDLGFDPFKDFVPITQALTFDFGLAASPAIGASTLAELVAWLKKNPQKGNFAVPGLGTLPHLLPMKFAADAGVELLPVPHKGIAPALLSVMSGDIALASAPVADMVAQHRAGKLRLLAVTGKTRSRDLPDVPTFVEQGYKIEGSGWYAFYAPAGTPADIVTKLNKTLVEAIRSDAFQQQARSVYLTATGTTPDELAAIQKADFELWAPVIKAAGLMEK
jgi:tripartite-type tricarboxylate transporter receptor subunit TctC